MDFLKQAKERIESFFGGKKDAEKKDEVAQTAAPAPAPEEVAENKPQLTAVSEEKGQEVEEEKKEEEGVSLDATGPSQYAAVTPHDGVAIRAEPSVSAKKLGALREGTVVEYIEDANDTYAHIKYKTESGAVKEGYATAKYLYRFSDKFEGFKLTAESLSKICPQASGYLSQLQSAFAAADISTKNRAAGFIAQTAVETAYYTKLKEDGSASYFTSHYEGRADLGNTEKGDGAKFCGRGVIQLTGRANYEKFGEMMGRKDEILANPEIVATDLDLAFKSAVFFWMTRQCNSYCDNDDIAGLSRRINGGTNGASERATLYKKAKENL